LALILNNFNEETGYKLATKSSEEIDNKIETHEINQQTGPLRDKIICFYNNG